MKKLFALLLTALLAACPIAALAAPLETCSGMYGFEYVYGYVHVFGEADIHVEPDAQSGVVGVAWRSEELDFLGDVAVDAYGVEWYRVVVNDNGNAGWISEEDGMLFED